MAARTLVEKILSAHAGVDILVAGANFGCGSAMEIAVEVLKAAGVCAVLASSFARTFYRNAVNQGLLALECDLGGEECAARAREGGRLRVEVGERAGVTNLSSGGGIPCRPPAPFILELMAGGGLPAYYGRHGEIPKGKLSG